jgi:hypothetical protein
VKLKRRGKEKFDEHAAESGLGSVKTGFNQPVSLFVCLFLSFFVINEDCLRTVMLYTHVCPSVRRIGRHRHKGKIVSVLS